MNLHEYQAKALFKEYGVPVPNGLVANTCCAARAAAEKLNTDNYVVKAQVHAGGRGRAGGVKLVDTPREAEDYAKSVLGTRLVTPQTDVAGQPINTVLVEEMCDVDKQFYIALEINTSRRSIVVTTSREGGVDIEQLALDSPDKIHTLELAPLASIQSEQCQELGSALGLSEDQIMQFSLMLKRLCKLFVEKDLALVEVNPLVLTEAGELICLGGKISIDDNALHRHKDLEALRDKSQEDEPECQDNS